MISPELLRRYRFFGTLDSAQLKAIAMISDESRIEVNTVIFEECEYADTLYLLEEGSVDLFYHAAEEFPAKDSPPPKEFLVGEINPGEVFSISALLEPYQLNATARAAKTCKVIKIDAVGLRKLMEGDINLSHKLMVQATKTLQERISGLRTQLAAAWS